MHNKAMKKIDAKELTARKNLARHLKYGDQKEIASLAGVSRNTVVNWIAGKSNANHVGEFIRQFAERRQAEVKSKVDKAFQQ